MNNKNKGETTQGEPELGRNLSGAKQNQGETTRIRGKSSTEISRPIVGFAQNMRSGLENVSMMLT